MKSTTIKRQLVFHPFLFAVYSVAGIYSRNASDIPIGWALRPLIVILALTAIVFFALKRVHHDDRYVGLLTTLSQFWFFYGHFSRVLQERSPYWNTTAGMVLSFLVWTVPLAFIGSAWTWRHISNPALVTTFLNATSAILVILPSMQAGGYVLQTFFQKSLRESSADGGAILALHPSSAPPDIYLIVLDAYGRSDFLKEVYGFENSDFISFLKANGFYVAESSTPNYPQTALSLSSMLNMEHLSEPTESLRGGNNRAPLNIYLHHSEVRYALNAVGYKFVALPTVISFTQIRDADVYYNMTFGDVNEFEGVLLSSTLLNLPIQALDLDIPVPSYDLQRRYILYSLDTLQDVPALPGPKFVFTHILGPHPPFVFDADGNPIQPDYPFNLRDSTFLGTPDEYVTGYVNETTYLNRRLEEVIEVILSTSERPPIIILQGDHGPANYYDQDKLDVSCLRERYSILNAYYFPDQNYSALYPSITPVNSFRVIFNQYFGTDLPMLEDRNYFAPLQRPFDYTEVTDKVQLACDVTPD